MTKKMLINATHPEEHRVAIVEDGILTELDIEISGKEQTKSNIYKAVVARVETGLQAAFVDYGSDRLGFLQVGEIHPSFFQSAEGRVETGKRPRINDLLRRGQEILVQIVKEERGTKGAALTTFLSLPGRYMVLMPESDTKGISRKIEKESDRKKLKELMNSLEIPEDMGYIVRTAGSTQKKTDLKRDVDYLLRLYNKIQTLSSTTKAPALIYKESNLVIRSIRDYFSDDMDEVLVDDPRVSAEAREFFQEVMPEYAELVKLHQERRPIFARYQIEEQIESISKNKVMLPSGGSVVIDSTEALVAIDVNSGKMASEQGVEATAYKTNIEAAIETARQLRLRDLGGLVVIDFIDMRDRKHIREVEKTLKDAMKMDKARVSIGRISQFGLLEMSRQRIKAALAEASFEICPHCNGSGKIKTVEAQALSFLRRIHAGLAKGNIGRVEALVPLDVASYLLNNKRTELLHIEQTNDISIHIKACPEYLNSQGEIEFSKREKEAAPAIAYIEASHVMAEVNDIPPTEEVDTEEKPAKRKRRSRRRRKPANTENTAETSDLEVSDGDNQSGEPVSPEGEVQDQVTPSAQDTFPVTAETSDQAKLDEIPATTTLETGAVTTELPEKPSRPRSRSRRRKPSTKKPLGQTEMQPEVKSEMQPEVKSEMQPEVKSEMQPVVKSEMPAVVKSEMPEEVKSETQPKTKRPARKRAPAKSRAKQSITDMGEPLVAAAANAPLSAEDDTVETPATSKPTARRARPRRTAKPATETIVNAVEAESVQATTETPPKETTLAAAKRRTSTKKSVNEATAAPTDGEVPVKKKPARRPRKPAVKATQESVPSETAPDKD